MIAVKIENLSKQYRLGTVSTRTLSHDLNRWWTMNIRGKEDPYLKIGEFTKGFKQNKNLQGKEEYIWALHNINLEVQQGEVLGIIGKNGAGKSTLLKILSKVTTPTTGTVKTRGRIASLLEVGTGFHLEMTGRENIFMNGAILGMTKMEIQGKLDEIIDFSGVEQFIDTPVKRYSSGMLVRLGFAVAAHLETEILVVDEVLAVGDMEFQKRAIGKMQDIASGQGKTVLFVSHNMTAVKNLCNNGIVLKDGLLSLKGNSIDQVIAYYLTNYSKNNNQSKIWNNFEKAPGNQYLKLIQASIESNSQKKNIFTLEDDIDLKFEFWPMIEGMNISITIEVFTIKHECVFKLTSNKISTRLHKYISVIRIPANFFNDNTYFVDLYFIKDDYSIVFEYKNILQLEIIEIKRNYNWHSKWIGITRPNFYFEILE